MIKGLYSAVSAMVMNSNRQELLSHDIANLETPGFKQILSTAEDFIQKPVVFPPGNVTHTYTDYVGMLGLGTQSGAEVVDFTQAGLQSTENPYDLGLDGDGFFRVQTPNGERFTRDGRFLKSPDGTLVTGEGYQVLNATGQPIKLTDGTVSFGPDGTITINGTQSGKLGLAVFQNPRADLSHTEGNYFSAINPPSTTAATARVSQGSLEMSNANATQLMGQLVEVGRSYEAAQQMVQNQDEMLGQTISSLGRLG